MLDQADMQMADSLNPTEEHYLKRELLRFQLNRELAALNDPLALRRFGYPFSNEDPKLGAQKGPKRGGLIQVMVSPATSLSRRSIDEKPLEENAIDEKTDHVKDGLKHLGETDFPMLSFVLQEVIMPFPLFSKDMARDEEFWQKKVQVFFEHFMSLGFSDSYDREEATRRQRIGKKVSKSILLLFNSGVGTSQERRYYSEDAFILKQDISKKTAGVEQFAIPTRESLQYLYTNEPIFIGGWDINVIAVVPDSIAFGRKSDPIKPKPAAFSPKWMRNAFTKPSSPAALFSRLGITDNHDSTSSSNHSHHFILKVRKAGKPEEIFYTAKSYDDFKKLKNALKAEFPGKQLAHLPHHTKKSISVVSSPSTSSEAHPPSTPKEKIVSVFPAVSPVNPTAATRNEQDTLLGGIESTESAESIDSRDSGDDDRYTDDASTGVGDDEDDDSLEEFHDAHEPNVNGLLAERMRTSLRQYLRALSSDKEVSLSSSFFKFLTKDCINPAAFRSDLVKDIERRQMVDVTNLENQVQFQRLALEKTLQLRESMKEFKTSLLRDENYLLGFIQELKQKTRVEDLSPMLFSFVEWCKIYISSTIYQMFLGNDSGYEFFTQVKRLNRLVPYSVMAQIMRFTNPMGIMKAIMDLFMAQPFGSQSLLQSMFSTVLSDDLKSQEKTIQKLEQNMFQEASMSLEVVECLKSCVFKNENSEVVDMEGVHKESEETSVPMSLVLLIKNADLGNLSHEAVGEVLESYSVWKAKLNSSTDLGLVGEEAGDRYFSHVKELLQLYIKERDKRLMRRLWQDPELSLLLKSMMTLFYEPMVKIFKVARVDVALRNFEKFMSDLIKLVAGVFDGRLGASTRFNVVESINDLVTKHQDSFLLFIHDVYKNDTEGIFEGFITWFVKIIKFLQNSKYGTDDLRINLNELLGKSNIDRNSLIIQLDNVIEKKQAARKIYRKILDLRMKKEQKTSNVSAAKVVENKWKELNTLVMPSESNAFGLQDGELVDLDLDAADYENLFEKGDDGQLEVDYQNILNKEIDEEEIEKFGDQIFVDELKNLLNFLIT